MAWRIVEVEDGSVDDLADGELIAISISLASTSNNSANSDNVYNRTRDKIQPQVKKAISN